MKALIPVEVIERKILLIRGEKVMLDSDLAELYGVEVKHLKRQVRRNIDRFPADFMIQLVKEEYESLRRHSGTLKRGEHSKYLPYAFTEQGVAMLSSILNSERAVKVNIEIMRAFVRLRQMLASNAELSRKLDALEKKYDAQFKVVFDAIRELMKPLKNLSGRLGLKEKKKKDNIIMIMKNGEEESALRQIRLAKIMFLSSSLITFHTSRSFRIIGEGVKENKGY